MSAQIVCDTQDHVALIQLQRPEKKNALSTAMYAALADAFAAAQADASVRVILIQGSATCFTAGNDLQDFLQQPPAGESAPVFRFLQAIATAQLPVVAAVAGGVPPLADAVHVPPPKRVRSCRMKPVKLLGHERVTWFAPLTAMFSVGRVLASV